METREEIFATIQNIMVDMFELDAAEVTLEAHLYDDLDIDSIDAVDMVVELKNLTGKKIKPDDFKAVRTVSDVVDVVETLVK
ncbi:acyl carrier protein [Simiduia sp. 21SJ11W-1]|uniref:acyl carrier protein n=1 Tax=Simiduia sp. 21SJ11W-1 TaxID=2909669 RepID=UPI00209E0B85|nr:acyl carrier protein [Simiduia sp. 21SJ11W-1]UTA48716.1 acyl carrier protein [Simiduia sp. 21SJ11W-1]